MENASHHDHDDGAFAWKRTGKASRHPVCGMGVDAHTAKHREDYAGKPYYFCSAGCKAKFDADPARYIKPPDLKAELGP